MPPAAVSPTVAAVRRMMAAIVTKCGQRDYKCVIEGQTLGACSTHLHSIGLSAMSPSARECSWPTSTGVKLRSRRILRPSPLIPVGTPPGVPSLPVRPRSCPTVNPAHGLGARTDGGIPASNGYTGFAKRRPHGPSSWPSMRSSASTPLCPAWSGPVGPLVSATILAAGIHTAPAPRQHCNNDPAYRPFNSRAVALSPLIICRRNSTEASGCTATKYIKPKCCVTSACMLGPVSWALTYPSFIVQRCIFPLFVIDTLSTASVLLSRP